MTDKQLHMYRAEWGKCRRVLRALGFSPKAADARRKNIHIATGAVTKWGKPKSSLYLNNADIDRVLKVFRSYSKPGDLQGQLDLINQPVKRALYRCKELLDDCGIADNETAREAYLNGICQRACKRPLIDSDDDDLVTILGALTHTWQHKTGVAHSHKGKPHRQVGANAQQEPAPIPDEEYEF